MTCLVAGLILSGGSVYRCRICTRFPIGDGALAVAGTGLLEGRQAPLVATLLRAIDCWRVGWNSSTSGQAAKAMRTREVVSAMWTAI